MQGSVGSVEMKSVNQFSKYFNVKSKISLVLSVFDITKDPLSQPYKKRYNRVKPRISLVFLEN